MIYSQFILCSKARSFDLPFHLDRPLYRSKSEPEKRRFLEAQARHARDRLVEELDFVLSRPEITSSLLRVHMFGYRYDEAGELLGYDIDSQHYLDFFGPIDTRVNALFQKAINVTTLFLNFFVITEDIARAIMSLRSLRKLTVSGCSLVGDPSLPQCPSLVNATLLLDLTQLSCWKLIRSWVNLRSLRIRSGSDLQGIGPGIEFRMSCNPFRALERLILERVDSEEIEEMCFWVQAARELRLTHFKVEAGGSAMYPRDLARILVSLRAAPLQVLVLDGLHYVGIDVFEAIAEYFPNLTSLSILYRESPRKTRSRYAIWPLPSWEYAPVLQLFHHLEFFGWNFGLDEMDWGIFPTLQWFEEGFPENWWDRQKEESLSDWDSVARVLAAYCQTLQHVAFLPLSQDCRITRSQSGSITVSSTSFSSFNRGSNYPTIGNYWDV